MQSTKTNNPEEDIFSSHISSLSVIEIQTYRQSLKRSRNVLFMVAAEVLVFAAVFSFLVSRSSGSVSILQLCVAAFVAGHFVLLGLWVKRKPYSAIVAGIISILSYFVLGIALFAWALGTNEALKVVSSAWIFPAVPLVVLFWQLQKAKRLQRAVQQAAS